MSVHSNNRPTPLLNELSHNVSRSERLTSWSISLSEIIQKYFEESRSTFMIKSISNNYIYHDTAHESKTECLLRDLNLIRLTHVWTGQSQIAFTTLNYEP